MHALHVKRTQDGANGNRLEVRGHLLKSSYIPILLLHVVALRHLVQVVVGGQRLHGHALQELYVHCHRAQSARSARLSKAQRGYGAGSRVGGPCMLSDLA